MTDTYGKSRQQAETAFSAVQTQFFPKNSALEELEVVAHIEMTRMVMTLLLASFGHHPAPIDNTQRDAGHMT